MLSYVVQAFVDGGFLRDLGEKSGCPFPHPRGLCYEVMRSSLVFSFLDGSGWSLHRLNFYDAVEESKADSRIDSYWDAIELTPSSRMGWGFLRRGSPRRKRTQKGVDTLLTVEMLSGAVDGTYDIGLMVAADGDFVPLLEEVRRRGKLVILAARERGEPGLSDELRHTCDLFVNIHESWLHPVMIPEAGAR